MGSRTDEHGVYGRRRLVLLGVACLALLIAGVAWRWPTLHVDDYLHFAAGHFSYSDMVAFYSTKGHLAPYQRVFDYPALIALVFWMTTFAPSVEWYVVANAVLLVTALFVCFVLLASTRPPARLELFALAPALGFYGVLNWDALALVWLVAAICLARSCRFGWAGVSIAIGTAVKLFPAFALPVLLAQALRPSADRKDAQAQPTWGRHVTPSAFRLVGGFFLTTVALNLPFALLNLHNWAFAFVFQLSQGSNLDSVWAGLPQLPNAAVLFVFAAAMLLTMAWVARRVFLSGHWEAGVLLALLLFYLFTFHYSPQYDLWVVPILALLCCPLWLWLAFVAADGAYYAAIFFFYFIYTGGEFPVLGPASEGLVRASVWARELVFAVLFAWGVAAVYGMTAGEGWRRVTSYLDARAAEYLAKYPTPSSDADR